MSFNYFSILSISFLFLLGPLAFGDEVKFPTKSKFGCLEPIKVSLFDFGKLYSKDKDAGVDKDLVKLLQDESGCQFEIQVKPRARIWLELSAGGTDLATAGISNPEREQYGFFVPYVRSKNVVLIDKKFKKVNSFEEFQKAEGRTRVGVVRSFKHGEKIDAFLESETKLGKVSEFVSVEDVGQAFVKGSIQMMFGASLVYPSLLEQLKLKDQVVIKDWETTENLGCFVFSRKRFNPEQLSEWKNLIDKVRKSKQFAAILKKHLNADEIKITVIKD